MGVRVEWSAKDMILKGMDAIDGLRTAKIERSRERFLGRSCTPPVFCKRVRKLLNGKGLAKYSFLKSM